MNLKGVFSPTTQVQRICLQGEDLFCQILCYLPFLISSSDRSSEDQKHPVVEGDTHASGHLPESLYLFLAQPNFFRCFLRLADVLSVWLQDDLLVISLMVVINQ